MQDFRAKTQLTLTLALFLAPAMAFGITPFKPVAHETPEAAADPCATAVAAVVNSTQSAARSVATEASAAEVVAKVPKPLHKSANWRTATTNPSQDGEFFATDKEREKGIKSFADQMGEEIIDEGAIPFVEFFPANGVEVEEVPTEGYQTRVLTDLVFKNLGAKGEAKGTFLLPVSGHQGEANARNWAKTDTYNLIFKYPDGRQVTLIKNAPSKDLVTAQELKFPPMEKADVIDPKARAEQKWSKVYKLEYHRSGSLGPGGYYEGRVINVIWDGT